MKPNSYPQTDCPLKRSVKLAIANPAGKYLLLRRAAGDRNRPNTLDMVGGGLEGDESPVEAAIREAGEESGIILFANQIDFLSPITRPSSHGHVNVRYFGHVALPYDPEVETDPLEHSGPLWLPRDEAFASLSHPPLREGFARATGILDLQFV